VSQGCNHLDVAVSRTDVPRYSDLMYPILRATEALGGSGSKREVLERVIEEVLEFDVDPSERDEWLKCEENNWSRFLEKQPGFVRRVLEIDPDD